MKKLSVIGHQLSGVGCHRCHRCHRCQVSGVSLDKSSFRSSLFRIRCWGGKFLSFQTPDTRHLVTLIVILLSFLFLQPVYTADKAPFDAYAWYLPYGQVLRVNYQLSKEEAAKLEGKKLQVTVLLKSQDGKILFEKSFPFGGEAPKAPDGTMRLQFKQPLPDGNHTVTVQLKGENGAVLQSAGNPIVVRKYAFEHNNIGKERVVIPPFEAISTKDSEAKVWGRKFIFTPAGLPEKVEVLGKDILAHGGVRLLLKDGSQTFEPKSSQTAFTLKTTDGYDATGGSNGSLGMLKYQLDSRLEYDGVYFIHLEIDSGGREVPVDSLTLLIPFGEGADTFSFQKNDRDTRSTGGYSRFDGIRPETKGVIWDARRLPQRSAYGLSCDNFFVPAIYVGSGSSGLWYYADSDWDWYLNPANEHSTLERVDGRVQLRILLVNDRLIWKGKRIFDFALMPQPVKPMPNGWRKIAWEYPGKQYVHDTAGWRYYGDGVNAFTLPTDEDYLQLGRVLAGESPTPPDVYARGNIKKRDDPRPQVLYGSNLMAGAGPAQGEFDTYSAEWGGPASARMPFDPDTKKRFQNRRSYGGFIWKDDISFKPNAAKWSDSWVDFAVYYQQKLVSLSRVNGTWFDNQSTFTIDGYTYDGYEKALIDNPNRWRPSDGIHAQNYGRPYHTLQFRRYLKRLATMCHTAGVQPFWIVNQQPTWSFAQLAWHVEGDYYSDKNELDLIEHLGVAGFRAHVKSQGGLIPRLEYNRGSGDISDQPPREGHPEKLGVRTTDATVMELPGTNRTHVGLCILHDIGTTQPNPALSIKLDQSFGFFDEGIVFQPYWEQKGVTVDSDRIYVSIFRNPAKKKAMAILFNEKKSNRGITAGLTIPEAANVRDLETGEPLVDLDAVKAGLQTRCYVPPRDFRLLEWEYKP